MAAFPQSFEECAEQLDMFLHGNKIGILKDVFQKIERDIQVRRLNVVLGFLACLALFFLASDGAHALCNFIGFVYPACVIIWNIEQGHVQLDSKKWLNYWIIFNAFFFVEYFLYLESPIWRLYSVLKCAFLALCFLPVPWNGSEKLYNECINPFLQSQLTAINTFLLYAWKSTNKSICAFVLMYCAYMLGFRFLCNILGFVYPVYISMVSLMEEPEIDRICCLTYWIVYSCCILSEYALNIIPFYYPIKFVLLGTFLLEPLAQRGLFFIGRKLILWYKPMNRANQFCHNIVGFFLASHQASQRVRVNQNYRCSAGVPSQWNITSKQIQEAIIKAQHTAVNPVEVNLQLSSPMVKAVLEMDVEMELVKKAIKLKLAQDGPGHNFKCAEDLLEAVFNLSTCTESADEGSAVDMPIYEDGDKDLLRIPHGGDSQISLEVIEENRQLRDQRLCKICMTEEVGMVFVPCGHLVCCNHCAFVLTTCPICRMDIESTMRTYLS